MIDPLAPAASADVAKKHPTAGRFLRMVVIVAHGENGIGRATALGFAKEGADLAIIYHEGHSDAKETRRLIEKEGREAMLIAGDMGSEAFCISAVEAVVRQFGRIDILCNTASGPRAEDAIMDVSESQLLRTFRTDVFSTFFLTEACLRHMHGGAVIVETASTTARTGRMEPIDHSSAQGALASFTHSLAQHLIRRNIRVNAVVQGPPFIPAAAESAATLGGAAVDQEHAGKADEAVPAILFLASESARSITGQVLQVSMRTRT